MIKMEWEHFIALLFSLLQFANSSKLLEQERHCSGILSGRSKLEDGSTQEERNVPMISGPLIVTEVTSDDSCFLQGQPYIVKAKFRYVNKKVWTVKLNGSAVENLNDIVFDKGLTATVRLNSTMYKGYGNTTLEIVIANNFQEKHIRRRICARRLLNDVITLTVTNAGRKFHPVYFYFKIAGRTAYGNFKIEFGDGDIRYPGIVMYPFQVVDKSYYLLGTFSYKWRFKNEEILSQGSGVIKVLNPVMGRYFYDFSQYIRKFWPDNHVRFTLFHKCFSDAPSEATFRLHFGDGEITSWLPLPLLRCYRSTFLVSHNYKEPGCYYTYFEMKNLLGRCDYRGIVKVMQPIWSAKLEVESIPPARRVEKEIEGRKVIYLRKEKPFEMIAKTEGGKCREFEWKIHSPYWVWRTREVDKMTIRHLIGKTGTYDIEVRVYNDQSSQTGRKRINLIASVSGLLLLASEPDEINNVLFYLLVEDRGTDTIFKWDFGEGKNFEEKDPVFQPALNLPNINSIRGAESLNIQKFVGFTKKHVYKSNGVYKASVIATGSFFNLSSNRTVYISKSLCERPIVKILIEKDKPKLTFNIGESFTLLSDVYIKCDDSDKAEFSWSLFKSTREDMKNNRVAESYRAIKFPDGLVTNQREITIQKRTLAPGIYVIKLLVIMKSLGYSESDQAYLDIVAEPMHVRIGGGAARLVSWENDILLDASSSYDPNVFDGDPKDLTYRWYCRVKPGSLLFKIGEGGCFGSGDGIVEHYDVKWIIPSKTFIRNAIYIVKLDAQSRTGRYGTFEQYLDVQAGSVMKTDIQCTVNCHSKIDPQTRLSLVGRCDDCGRHVTFKWNLLYKTSLKKVSLKWMSDTRTPQNSISMVLVPGLLQKSIDYLARLTVSTPTGEMGYTDYGITLSDPPYGGFCNVTPPVGEAVKTHYYISCYNWRSESTALQYSISLVKSSVIVGALKDTAESELLSYGPLSYTTTKLPEGAAESNYNQILEIRIIDSYGASIQINTTVQVFPFTAEKNNSVPDTFDSPIESELETYVHGKASTLQKLVSAGDLQGIGRFTKAIGKSLESAKNESAYSEISDVLMQKRKRKREKMRDSIVSSLTDTKITTLDNLGLISTALEDVSFSSDELSKESQDKMLDFYDHTSKFMDETYAQWEDRDPKLIQDAFGSFLEGVGNMMESAVLSRSLTEGKERIDYLRFTENTLSVIENSTSLLFRSMVANEIAKRISSDSISIEVKKTESGQLDRFKIKTLAGGLVQTPSARGIFGGNGTDEIIDMKMVSLSNNPYTWDAGKIGKILTPTISSVKFLSNGSTIPVQNLPPGEELVIEIPTPKIVLTKATANVTSNKLAIIKMTLPAIGLSMMIKPRCYGSSCRVFVLPGTIPTINNYEDKFDIIDSSKNKDKEEFKLYHSLNITEFNVGILKLPEPSLNTNDTVDDPTTFVMECFSTGCFYWEEQDQEWKSDGCKISKETNPNRTICLCNHLSWFGAGVVVQPNVIDVKKEVMKIKDIADYPALLATVCVVLGLYLLAMIWARHRDKNDVLKAALTIVDKCCQTHKYRYDITIYTGTRLGAGTSSYVSMILGGRNGESDPHCLSNHSNVLFQRGNVDSFLVTSEKDLGAIVWIRIWHDNSGRNASWYLSRIIVTDIVRGKQTVFICQTWLGIGIGRGKIDDTFLAAAKEEVNNFRTLFIAKISQGFSDDHLWSSIAMRPPRSNFTRCQRVSCCLSALLCTMLANAMFYKIEASAGTQIQLGSFEFNWNQIIIGVESALIIIPIDLIIVTLFRKAAPTVAYEAIQENEFVQAQKGINDNETGLEIVQDSSTLMYKKHFTSKLQKIETTENTTLRENKRDCFVSINAKDVHANLMANEEVTVTCSQESPEATTMDCTVENKINVLPPISMETINAPLEDHMHLETLEKRRTEIGVCSSTADESEKSEFRRKSITNSTSNALNRSDSRKLKNDKSHNYCSIVPGLDVQRKLCKSNGQAERKNQPKSKASVSSEMTLPVEIYSESTINSEDFASEVIEEKIRSPISREDVVVEVDFRNLVEIESQLEMNCKEEIMFDRNITTNVIRDVLARKKKDSQVAADTSSKKDILTFWPHWCLYIGWIVCSLTTLTAGFFTILYGLSFGRVVQEEWLVSFFTSVFQDVFISQPAKVILLGCVFAVILKKLHEEGQLPEIELAKNNEWIKNHLPLQEKKITDSRVKIPLADSFVKKAHQKMLTGLKHKNITIEIMVYLFYILLALLMAYGHRSPSAYGMTQTIKSLVMTEKFDQVRDVDDFWEWMHSSFLSSIYNGSWYNEDLVQNKGFIADHVTYLIGSPRLRQIRVKRERCLSELLLFAVDIGKKECEKMFTWSNEDKSSYSRGWGHNISVPDAFAMIYNREDPWQYFSDSDLNGHRFTSQINTYPGGGYVRTLGKTFAEANSTLVYLKDNLWLDAFTRALFLEFSTYNNNNNFYCIATLVFEFNPDGGVSPFSKVITTRLDRYNSDFSFFLGVCEISFLLLTLYYMWLELTVFRRKGFSYFRHWSSFMEIFTFSVTWTAFVLLIVRIGVVKWTKENFTGNPGGFTNFQYAASSDLAYGYALAAVVAIAFLRVLKILRFNKTMLLLLNTLQRAGRGMRHYILFFGIAFAAFTQWAQLCFGRYLFGYSEFVKSFVSLLLLLLGNRQFSDLQRANWIFGPIFFIMFVFFVRFILVNLFLTMIMHSFAEVREEMAGQPSKYEVFRFWMERLEKLFPLLKNINKSSSVLSENEVEDYYDRRSKQRKGEDPDKRDIATIYEKMEYMEHKINRLFLSDCYEINAFVLLELKLRRERMEKDDNSK